MFTKYVESGLSTIPLFYKSKSPMIKDWSKYCYELPSETDCERWEQWFDEGKCGIGLCLGEASGVIAVDIDSDNEELKKLVPNSPCAKIGAKGETRFFKYSKNIKLAHYNSLDILSDGSQTVLPPSIHPKTGEQYKWVYLDLLKVDKSNLPELDLTFVEKYIALANKIHPELSKKGEVGGRNNWLKSIVSAQRFAGDSESDIVNNIYNLDLNKNTPRLFTDASEKFSAKNEDDAKRNAWSFVNSVSSSLIKDSSVPLPVNNIDFSTLLDKPKPFVTRQFTPPPHGLLKHIFEYILKSSPREQVGLSIGGAIALGSVIISNIYKFQNTYSNVYIMNVAPTGAGKSFPEKCIKSLLSSDDSLSCLIGSGGFKSGSSIEKDLNLYKERIDLIDECSTLFSTAKTGNQHQTEILDVLSKLYSSSGSTYLGSEWASKEKISAEFTCRSILMSTNQTGFDDTINKSTRDKGLLPRCIIFNEDYGVIKSFNKSKDDLDDSKKIFGFLADELIRIRSKYSRYVKENLTSIPIVKEIEIDHEASTFLTNLRYEYDPQKFETEMERSFFTRFPELITKVALISGALNNERISLLDVSWAKGILETCYHNIFDLKPSIDSKNDTESNVNKILTIIKRHGSISKNDLTRKTQFLKRYDREDALKTLVDSEQILCDKNINSKKVIYTFNK